MAYAIDVRADVIDIQTAPPPPNTLFVDTNVWFWYAYPRASLSKRPPRPYQKQFYPAFLGQAFASGCRLYHSGLELAELVHLIENSEREAYNTLWNKQFETKDFRHSVPQMRKRLFAEVKTVWDQVELRSESIDFAIEPTMTRAVLNRYAADPLDGYDLFFIEPLLQSGSSIPARVLTDDGDFAAVPGIVVYTANRSVVDQARIAGRLITP
ncbi:MAG: hypothetical protein ABFC38_13805 [Methanospirillum sp.]